MSRILFIENSDFKSHPKGGTLAFDIQLLKVLSPKEVALVGVSTVDDIPTGRWTTVEINGLSYEYFSIYRDKSNTRKPIVPIRLTTFILLLWYLPRIRKRPYRYVFSRTPQFLFALTYFKWSSICFCFAGVENSVALSRYKPLRFLGQLYEKKLFKILKNKVDVVLAAGDTEAINNLIKRSKGVLDKVPVHPFPTRFDSNIFKPMDLAKMRGELKIPFDKKVLVSIGRLSWVKGWDLLIDLIRSKNDPDYILILVGDGEDRAKIEKEAGELIHQGRITITGFLKPEEVSRYINISDVVLVASFVEGWSTAMVEAIACGKPIVSTKVSGASAIIREGENGYILKDRNVVTLSGLIEQALNLPNYSKVSLEIAKKYSLNTLFSDLKEVWPQTKDIL